MAGKNRVSKKFSDLVSEDYDLTMFTIQSLTLVKEGRLVIMSIVLKRKVATELLTTYLPTILLLLITFTTIFFDKDLFGDAIAVNLTIMLVMTTIFTSKIEELPSTSDTKMIDIWLIGCLLVPFTEVVLRTIIEVLGNCHPCKEIEAKEDERKKAKRSAWETPQCSPVMSSKDLTPFPAELTAIPKKESIGVDIYNPHSCRKSRKMRRLVDVGQFRQTWLTRLVGERFG